ncbi:MAG: hypothetical protein KAJ54_03220, partial [Candidatus Aenigmarchaeota archaeon]|nr:hypothetical protein [Candidatus Aenigmarchaeota archaeon]
MKLQDYLQSSSEYLLECLKKDNSPELDDNDTVADFHAHADIFSKQDLYDTLDSMVKNNVDLLAITHRILNLMGERTYDDVKGLIKEQHLEEELGYEDLGRAFRINHKGRKLTLVGAYEVEVSLDKNSRFLNHMIVLMPNKGFDKYIDKPRSLEDFTALGKEYKAILIGAHPYSVRDTQARSRLFKYRVAPSKYHSLIEKKFSPAVDCVDCVSSNVGWMKLSNDLLEKRYNKKPLWTSDASIKSDFGRAGTIF